MRIIQFNTEAELPIVEARVHGPNGSQRVRIIFDTGAGNTQLDTALVEDLGYSASNALDIINIQGPVGDVQEGYLIELNQLGLFGIKFCNIKLGVYDFDNFDCLGIDGILGFDLIKQLHLEMIGSEGILKILNQ